MLLYLPSTSILYRQKKSSWSRETFQSCDRKIKSIIYNKFEGDLGILKIICIPSMAGILKFHVSTKSSMFINWHSSDSGSAGKTGIESTKTIIYMSWLEWESG